MDLGSAVLSAQLALELLDDEARRRVLLCPAPLVEGLIVAAVAAGAGAGRDEVAAEALGGLAGKQSHLTEADPGSASPAESAAGAALVETFTVVNPHGLHARPAARLVQQAGTLDALIELRNATTGSAWVPATSLSKVATLGAGQGHQVQIRAAGPQARPALDALRASAGRGFDEVTGQAVASAPAATSAVTGPVAGTAVRQRGPVPASPGIGIGPARLLGPARLELPAELPVEPAAEPAAEWERLTAARTACRDDIRGTRAATASQVGEWAAAIDRVAAALAALPDPYLRARAGDVRAVRDQVLRRLLGEAGPDGSLADVCGVVVAADLTPAQAAGLDPARVAGLVLAVGSPTAHSAILARARGVPAVVGAGPAVLDTVEGTTVALDRVQ